MKRTSLKAILILTLISLTQLSIFRPAAAETSYIVFEIGTDVSGVGLAYHANINELGQVTCCTEDPYFQQAFIWHRASGLQRIGGLYAQDEEPYSCGLGINNSAQIVGESRVVFGDSATIHGFIWDSLGGIRDLGTLSGIYETSTTAININDNGEVVGRGAIPGVGGHGFIWDPINGMRDLNDLIPVYSDFIIHTAYDINNIGQVVGESRWPHHPFFLDRSGAVNEFVVLSDIRGSAYAMNETGKIVGSFRESSSNQWHAFIWDRSSGMTDLGTLGHLDSSAQDINNFDQVVGHFTGGAFLWDPINGMRNLDQLISADLGLHLYQAYAINNRGQIVATGGSSGLVLLTPVPSIGDILDFFDVCVEDGYLVGDGPGNSAMNRLNALRKMIERANDLINTAKIDGACGQLMAAYKKCDGENKPPDFCAGGAALELSSMIDELMTALECDNQ